jgi:hypothetical protein
MGFRHKRCTVERTNKELLRYEKNRVTTRIVTSTNGVTPQTEGAACHPKQLLSPDVCFNDQTLNVTEIESPELLPGSNTDNVIFPTIHDNEPAVDRVLINHASVVAKLQLSKTDAAMLNVYNFASQRGVSITFIEELFRLLRKLDSKEGGIEISKTRKRKTLLKHLKQYMESRKKSPLPAVVQVASTECPIL